MTTTRIEKPTPDHKQRLRNQLAAHTADYLAGGGTITQCGRYEYTTTNPDGAPTQKRKFDKVFTPDSLTDPTNRTQGGVG